MAISLKGTKYTIPIDHSMYAIQKKERQPRHQLHHMFIKYTIQNPTPRIALFVRPSVTKKRSY